MKEFHNKKGWLEEEIERTKVFINTTRLKDLMETVRAYTADEEPVLDKDKPFQLWTHFQDEPPGIFEGFHEYEVAIARGCEYSLKPIIYGTVTLRDEEGRVLAEFEDGKVSKTRSYTPGTRINPNYKPNIVEFSAVLCDGKRNKNDDILVGPIEIKKKWNDPRPSWDAYFIAQAFLVSRRSLDRDTKHGCVLVKDKRIISSGFNSPPPGFIDSEADLGRPGKYLTMVHSEINCIANAAREGYSTKDSTCYLSGFPCSDCYRALWSAGVKEIIYAPINLSAQYSSEHISYLTAARNGPKLTPFSKEQMKEVIKILDDEYDYIIERVDFNTPTPDGRT